MNIEKDFEYWVDSLIEEGYDLSDYTWDEIYEEYLSEAEAMFPGLGRSFVEPVNPEVYKKQSQQSRRANQSKVSQQKEKQIKAFIGQGGFAASASRESNPETRAFLTALSRTAHASDPGQRIRYGTATGRQVKSSEGKPIAMARTAASAASSGTSLPNAPQRAVTLNKGYAAKLGGKDVNVVYKNIGGKIQRQTISKDNNKVLKTEDFEYWVDSLFEEGYDLSNYTWKGLFEYFCENVLSEEVRSGKGTTRNSAATPAATPPRPATPPAAPAATPAAAKGPTILASRNGVAGTMIKGDPSSWKAKEGGYSSSEMQRIRSVGTKRYETQRKAAVSSGKPEDFKSTTQTGREVWSMANPKLAQAATTTKWGGSREAANKYLYNPGTAMNPRGGTPLTSRSPEDIAQRPPSPQSSANTDPQTPSANPAPAPVASTQKTRPQIPQSQPVGREELLIANRRKPLNSSFDFSSPSKVASDMAYLYQSIYEGKKKVDQDMDGDNDFADVMIARMVAAGVPRAEAIRRVRNKEYNV